MTRLTNPSISLFDALCAGGFCFPQGEYNFAKDSENVSLKQRKNQLCRRLRIARQNLVRDGCLPSDEVHSETFSGPVKLMDRSQNTSRQIEMAEVAMKPLAESYVSNKRHRSMEDLTAVAKRARLSPSTPLNTRSCSDDMNSFSVIDESSGFTLEELANVLVSTVGTHTALDDARNAQPTKHQGHCFVTSKQMDAMATIKGMSESSSTTMNGGESLPSNCSQKYGKCFKRSSWSRFSFHQPIILLSMEDRSQEIGFSGEDPSVNDQDLSDLVSLLGDDSTKWFEPMQMLQCH